MWHSSGLTSPITYLLPAPSPTTSSSNSPQKYAVAYTDGSIRLWTYDPSSLNEVAEVVTFNGHKKTITTLCFDSDGSRLASGGSEGEIVIWDRVAEVGLFRLKGHRGPVTGLNFIPHPSLSAAQHPGFLLSVARDSMLKLWDLGTQHCLQTDVIGRGEVWSLAVKEVDQSGPGQISEDENSASGRWMILTGAAEGEAKVWTLERSTLSQGISESKTDEVSQEAVER